MLNITHLRRIADIWEELDDSQPTERLFALTCDRASAELGCEVGTAHAALRAIERLEKKLDARS